LRLQFLIKAGFNGGVLPVEGIVINPDQLGGHFLFLIQRFDRIFLTLCTVKFDRHMEKSYFMMLNVGNGYSIKAICQQTVADS
jgi:hypothetical protein